MAIVADAPRWKTVLFDLDGTLINTIPLIVATFHRTFEHFGVQAPDDEVMKSWIGLTLEDTFRPVAGEDAADEWVAVYRKFNQEMHDDAVAPFALVCVRWYVRLQSRQGTWRGRPGKRSCGT